MILFPLIVDAKVIECPPNLSLTASMAFAMAVHFSRPAL